MIRMTVFALLLVAGCGEPAAGPGTIEVRWTGADSGRLRVPAVARWCSNDSAMEITGAAGDSGVALAVLPRDSLTVGVFPVGAPRAGHSRPGARMALRWPGQTLVEGYYGLSGSVTVDSGDGLNGRVEATMTNVNSSGRISLTGEFRGLSLVPGSIGACGGPLDDSVDSVVE